MPDLPGYGASGPIEKNDKLSVGRVVLEALEIEVKKAKGTENGGDLKIVLIGHDRGARVAHHLTVSGVAGIDILGVCLIDIVRPISHFLHSFKLPFNTHRSQLPPSGSISPPPPSPQKK